MNLTYKRATLEDIDVLTETRIAYKTLDLLVKDAKSMGITDISLEATDMGRPLYEKYGFVKMNHEMELPECLVCC